MPTRLKYDGLPPGSHTFTYDEKLIEGRLVTTAQPVIEPGAVIEVEDLNDPKSERARICRDHVARGIAHVIEPKGKAAAAPKD